MSTADNTFSYEALPVFDAFEQVSRSETYTPLPDDWILGATDVVRSTDALLAGRYKAVNMAGASIVSAVMNSIGDVSFPFVFGGDGAVLAVSPRHEDAVRDAMGKTIRFVAEDLDLTLRAGTLSVRDVRAAGHDVRVARYAASPQAVYAMFAGGGASYASAELKAGRISVAPAPAGARPSLAGLSCRWSPLPARRGLMLSLVVLAADGAAPAAFAAVTAEIIATIAREERSGHPVAPGGPDFNFEPKAMHVEGKVTRRPGEPAIWRTAKIVGQMLAAMTLDRAGRSAFGFDPRRYRSWVARNTDFRKFEDGLRMTIDCSEDTADRLEALLAAAETMRIVDYGLHRQEAALMTCIVPSPFHDDHMHFLDGAGGGYALSALNLKTRLAERTQAALAS